MEFKIRLGKPSIEKYWKELKEKHQSGTANKDEEELYSKWGKAMKLISQNPKHPSLKTHEISDLTRRVGKRVWQSYLENKRSDARRIYWVYGPNHLEITIIGLEPHPEDSKNGAYARIPLSTL